MDLVDLSSLSRYNRGFKYLLSMLLVSMFYPHLHGILFKNKTGPTIFKFYKRMFSSGRTPPQIHTDRGGEFINKHVHKILKDKNIHYFTTNNEAKASVVERFNRTLISRMWEDFTHRDSLKYVDVLPIANS